MARVSHALLGLLLLVGACGDGGGGDPNAQFAHAANTPMNVYFDCLRANSGLVYRIQLLPTSAFGIAAQLDTGDIASASGTYTYENNVITLRTNPNNFILFEEQTNRIEIQLGLVFQFQTQNMICQAIGHEEDDPAGRIGFNYRCPTFREGPASEQENAFEFDVGLPGAIFRQRDRLVQFNTQPIVQRGSGIYRRRGAELFGYFGNQFDDYNSVTGSFLANNAAVRINQLPSGFTDCTRR